VLRPEEVNAVDRGGLWKAYRSWPEAASRALAQPLKLPSVKSTQSIILAGMGGSGAACDIVADWSAMNSGLPATVIKGYRLPRFAGRRTLVVLVSLSGDTKEALSLLRQGVDRKCEMVAISSGGKLERMCHELGVPHNRVERMMVPRASLPGMVLVALRILEALGLARSSENLEDVVASLRRTFARISPEIPLKENEAKKLAKALVSKTPVIYVPVAYASVGHHFQASMNENAKVPVMSGSYPEIFHNEVETWGASFERAVLLLRHGEEEKEVTKRLVRAKSLMSKAGIPVFELYEKGGALCSLLDWCLFLDMVSIYVAVLRKTPPVETPLLDGTRPL
jgi:glucose/mannose-6-phosphate isomerase